MRKLQVKKKIRAAVYSIHLTQIHQYLTLSHFCCDFLSTHTYYFFLSYWRLDLRH